MLQSPQNTSPKDIRAVLHYVPQFIGHVFVVELDWALLPQTAKAELMMDLCALQSIGVRLLLSVEHSSILDLTEWSTELEFKMAQPCLTISADPTQITPILQRGQACLMDRGDQPCLSSKAIAIAKQIGAAKIITLNHSENTTPAASSLGAIALSELVKRDSPQPEIIQRAQRACEEGIDRVHILDAQTPGVFLDELFSNEGAGTMIHKDSYQQIRPLREEDIPELLGMIGRSVRNSNLVPRNYEAIQSQLDHYHVICLDDHVVGSIALHPYSSENQAEIACLYVKHSHESRGYGAALVAHTTELAIQGGYERVFALTNRAADFFLKLGFQRSTHLPAIRRQQLDDSGRDSAIFEKQL